MRFLGAITGASGSYSNAATGASGIGTFAIPPGTRSLYLQQGGSGLINFEIGVATGISFQTSANAAALNPSGLNGPFRVPLVNVPAVVAIYYTGSGFVSCRVYASPTT